MGWILRRRDECGFSLMGLMIVVLIIGILIAVALPVYVGARTRASDRATQEGLRTGLAAGLAYYAPTRDWTSFDAAQAQDEEVSLAWIDGGAAVADQIPFTSTRARTSS